VSETRRPRYRLETPRDGVDGDDVAAAAAPRSAGADPAAGWSAAIDLERALRALPQAQRQVLLLVAFEDMSYEQVATVVGVPVGTVMSRLSRARSRLRQLLDPDAGAAPGAAPPETLAAPPEPLAAPRLKLMK